VRALLRRRIDGPRSRLASRFHPPRGTLGSPRPTTAPNPQWTENPQILIFVILMRGMAYSGRGPIWRSRNPEHTLLCTGAPPTYGSIDCMQLVATRSTWLEIGGWYDRSETADAAIYSKLVQERGARYVTAVLGEHW